MNFHKLYLPDLDKQVFLLSEKKSIKFEKRFPLLRAELSCVDDIEYWTIYDTPWLYEFGDILGWEYIENIDISSRCFVDNYYIVNYGNRKIKNIV